MADSDFIHTAVSCKDDYDPESLSPDQANQQILSSILPQQKTIRVAIRESLGRILAKDIVSSMNVPSATNSAMDGYAVNGEDLPATGTKHFSIIGNSFAGNAFPESVDQNQAVRIMTGAVMPTGTDTVVMQEHVEKIDEGNITIGQNTRAGANVRDAGEDIRVGDVVLSAGRRISPADIGLIASLGQAEVEVYENITVAFFSTGDELRSIGDDLEEGMIYDSNRYTLYGMLHELGVNIIDLGVIRDVEEEIVEALSQAAREADVILTSGGVSVGDADFVKPSLLSLGEMNFWKVAMKPGRPLTFGKIDEAYFFGLPGNPVSVMVTFYQFVQPALKRLMGYAQNDTFTVKVRCNSKLKKRPGRVEYQRGILTRDDAGELMVEKTGAQGSGILKSMSHANCFIILPMESEGVAPGDLVEIQPFHGGL